MFRCSCVSLASAQDPKGSEVVWVRDCDEVVHLDGLTEVEVSSAQDLLQVHRRGSALRHTGNRAITQSEPKCFDRAHEQTLFNLKYDDQSDLSLLYSINSIRLLHSFLKFCRDLKGRFSKPIPHGI